MRGFSLRVDTLYAASCGSIARKVHCNFSTHNSTKKPYKIFILISLVKKLRSIFSRYVKSKCLFDTMSYKIIDNLLPHVKSTDQLNYFFWCLPILQPILLLQFGYTGNYFMQGLVNSSYPEALVAGDCALVNISHNFLTLTKHSWLRGCENFPWGVTSSYVTPVQAVCIRYDHWSVNQLKETLGWCDSNQQILTQVIRIVLLRIKSASSKSLQISLTSKVPTSFKKSNAMTRNFVQMPTVRLRRFQCFIDWATAVKLTESWHVAPSPTTTQSIKLWLNLWNISLIRCPIPHCCKFSNIAGLF